LQQPLGELSNQGVVTRT